MKKTKLFLALIIFIGIALRFLYYPSNIYFGYDQARDAFISQKIYTNGDLKIQGPPSSGVGIYHGPLLYYILGPLYLLGSGDPQIVILFFILINILSIFLMYLISKNTFKNETISLIAALLFAFSYEQTQWAIFQSNTSLAAFGLMVLFYGLSLWWFSKKQVGTIISALGLGIATQSEVYLLYLLIPIGLIYFLKIFKNDHLSKERLLSSIFILSILLSTFVISEIVFKFRGLNSVIATFGHPKIETASFVLNHLIDRFGQIGYNNISGISPFWGFISLITLSIYTLKSSPAKNNLPFIFTITFLFSSIILTIIGQGFANIYHLSLGASIFAILLASNAIYRLSPNKFVMIVIVFTIILLQLNLVIKNNQFGATLTLVQKRMLLSDEKKVVELIARETDGKDVGIYVVSNPFNVNTVWSYIFKQYWPKEKQLPQWFGDFAQGYEGESIFTKATSPHCTNYIIYEPLQGVPEHLLKDISSIKEGGSFNVTKQEIGAFTVEKIVSKECIRD